MASPPYNKLGDSPIPSGVSIGIKTDSVIDMPAENGTVVQTYFAGGKVAYNPQYNHHVPAQYSPRPQHMQLQLQTSINDLQRQMESPSPPEKYRETPMSEKQFLSNSHNTLCIPGTNLSRSNPTVSTSIMNSWYKQLKQVLNNNKLCRPAEVDINISGLITYYLEQSRSDSGFVSCQV